MRELTLREIARDIGRRREEHGLSLGDGLQRALGERLLVCLPSDRDAAEGLLCKGWREASNHGVVWYAVHVETPQESLQKITTRDFRALLDNVNLAIDLGAELFWLKSSDVVGAIIAFAYEKRISKIILRRARGGFWRQLHHHSIPERLFHQARDFDVEVVSDEF